MRLFKPLSGALLALALVSCRQPIEYPVPPQKTVPAGEEAPVSRLIRMAESGSESYVAGDVLGGAPDSPWRWTNQHPRLQVKMNDPEGWKFKVRFVTPEVVLKRTGPLTVTFIVNGETMGTRTYSTDGEQTFEAKVDPAVIQRHSPVIFGMDIDQALVAEDGVKLCLLLIEIGFEESVEK